MNDIEHALTDEIAMDAWLEVHSGNEVISEIKRYADKQDNAPTLRDQFAMAALQGLLAEPNLCATHEEFAERAYRQADAMIEARK